MKSRSVIVVLSLLVVALGGAVIWLLAGRTEEPTEDRSGGITEAEHDRLLDACIAYTDGAPACVSYVLGLVETAEADGSGYRGAAEGMNTAFEQQRQSQEADAAAGNANRFERDLEAWEELFDWQATSTTTTVP